MLAQESAGFRERQLLRIVAGEAKPVARRKLGYGPRQRASDQFTAAICFVGAAFSRPNRPSGELIVRQRLQPSPGAQVVDVPLRKHGTEPRREAAASVEITKERSLEQLAIDGVRQFPSTSSGIERVGRAIQCRALFANEKFPRPLLPPPRTAA